MQNKKEVIYVDIADFRVASGNRILKTSAIGSCLAITLYDPVKKIGALIHSMLPGESNNPSPKYVGSAIELALKEMQRAGANIEKLKAQIIGGADMFSSQEESSHNIGVQNVQSALKKLKEKGIKIINKETGGNLSRSVEFDIATGKILVQ